MKQDALVDRKLDVMNLLWERGPATVRELHRELVGSPYSAVRALVHVLEQKGCVRAEVDDGVCRYCPALTRRELGRRTARHVLRRHFGGSVPAFLRALAATAGWPEERVRGLWPRTREADSESWLSGLPT